MMWETKEKPQETRRKPGREARIAAWLARHPGALAAPAAVGYGLAELGPVGLGSAVGGVAASMTAWYRWHPATFDRLVLPHLRSWRRRWLSRAYLGRWWQDTMISCGLVVEDPRRPGEGRIPRVLRVRAHTPTVETVTVKIHKGQSLRQFIDRVPELTEALGAERVSIMRVRPLVLALIVQRSEPFGETIPSPAMPGDSDAVDLSSIYLGDTEYGTDWTASLVSSHWLTAGATGSGKGSFTWGCLRAIAPLIRDGLVRPYVCDPKQVELAPAADAFYRYGGDGVASAEVIEEFLQDQRDTQARLKDAGLRKAPVSREYPLNILIMDELAEILAYGDRELTRNNRQALALIGSQGRATGHVMHGSVQEPSKEVVSARELFTHRLCLRVTAENQVDMVLGDKARERGALADEIPAVPDTAGIGFVIRQRTRVPMRVRLAYSNDNDVKEFRDFVVGGRGDGRHLKAVA